MKYSIIIPVYNTERYLHQCVESVLQQSFTDFEVLLVDDGSTDASSFICDELHKRDERVKVIHQQNSGPGIARNTGIEIAKGDYIMFLDSDDFWVSDSMLETISNCINTCDIAVFDLQFYANGKFEKPFSDCLKRFDDYYSSGEDYLKVALSLSKGNTYCWWFWRYIFSRSLFDDESLRFENQKRSEDIALLYRILLKARNIHVIHECFYAYRTERGDSSSKIATYETVHGVLFVAEREIKRVQSMCDITNETKRVLCSFLCEQYFLALTLASLLPESEETRIIDELEHLRWIGNYGQGKENIKKNLIKILGVKTTCKLFKYKNKLFQKIMNLNMTIALFG